MRNELHRSRIFIRIAVALDRQIAAIADDVCIRHDRAALDGESRSRRALHGAGVPRRLVVRLDIGRGDADDALVDFAVRLRNEICREQESGANQEVAAAHRGAEKIKQMTGKSNWAARGEINMGAAGPIA